MVDQPFEVSGPDTVIVRLHVQPGAGRTAVSGRYGDALKIRVAAPPEGGRANEACLALLASVLGVKAAQLELTAGASSRTKRVKVTGADPEDVRHRLADAVADAQGSGAPGHGHRGDREQGGSRRG